MFFDYFVLSKKGQKIILKSAALYLKESFSCKIMQRNSEICKLIVLYNKNTFNNYCTWIYKFFEYLFKIEHFTKNLFCPVHKESHKFVLLNILWHCSIRMYIVQCTALIRSQKSSYFALCLLTFFVYTKFST